MRALTKELPDLKLFSLFQMSFLGRAMDLPPAQREAALRDGVNWGTLTYGLTPAFLNGMLDAAAPRVVIIDGNEGSYYYTETLDFYRDYHVIKSGALSLIAPENQRKYQAQVQAA